MADGGRKSVRSRRSATARLKRALSRGLVRAAERVDFVGLLRRVAESESGRPWLERYGNLPSSWPDLEKLNRLAVELTLAQLKAEGQAPQPREVEALIGHVATGYDRQIYLWGLAGVTVLLNTMFVQQDPARSFVSADGRELAHLDWLKERRDQGLGVVYLVNHSSHLDEFVLNCVLGQTGLGLNLFAAGANMMAIKSLAKVLMVGSYVVQRRGASKYGLAALFNYCRAISESGGQQGIFLEAWYGGARTRDGGLRHPRRLVTLRGALASGKDVVVQPVALSYSVVPEDLSLAARQSPLCWVRGMGLGPTLGRAVIHPKSWIRRSLQGLYGRAYLTLCQPRLLSELKQAHVRERQDLEVDEFVNLTAIREIARCKKVMASQLTARGLLRAGRQEGGGLRAAVEQELEVLREYHLSTFGQEPDLEDFIRQRSLSEVTADGLATLKRRAVVSRWQE
ncbi:MAG: 1-acyl-sn-glycerol-3-phosphate acyltransferase, partial [Deltaproteobacteria bacterium]|nr:1-acyl-sn-glycerol-3-phosphate acyltransferase [Deltaproteobacteria bacterium]